MAVAIDAKGTALVGTTAVLTIGNYTGLTVGATANALIAVISLIPAPATNPVVHWDSAGANQLMTLIGVVADTTNVNGKLYLFGLLSPSTGNKTMTCTWTTTSARFCANAISFTGADTAFATAFQNFASTDNTTSQLTTTQTLNYSNAGNSVGLCCLTEGGNQAISSQSDTSWFFSTFSGVGASMAQTQAPSSGSSHNFTWTVLTAIFSVTAAVEISPPGAPAAALGTIGPAHTVNRLSPYMMVSGAMLAKAPPVFVPAAPAPQGSTLPFMGVG